MYLSLDHVSALSLSIQIRNLSLYITCLDGRIFNCRMVCLEKWLEKYRSSAWHFSFCDIVFMLQFLGAKRQAFTDRFTYVAYFICLYHRRKPAGFFIEKNKNQQTVGVWSHRCLPGSFCRHDLQPDENMEKRCYALDTGT